MEAIKILELARENTSFRTVVATGTKSQLVLMSLLPGEEIGEEVHTDVDQTLVFVVGNGTAVLNDSSFPVAPGDLVFVPAGTKHNFINSGSESLKLYTVYAPPEHRDGTVHETKADAMKDEHDHFDE